MNDSLELVGSFAKIAHHGIDSMEDATFQIVAYDEERDMFEVLGNSVLLSVRLQQLTLFEIPLFVKLCPAADVIYGLHGLTEIPRDTIVDLTSTNLKSDVPSHVTITKSCRLFGNWNGQEYLDYLVQFNNRISTAFTVDLANADDIVEFQGLTFESTVACIQGTIVFRSCTFEHHRVGVTVNSPLAHVLFERCHFSGQCECSLVVTTGYVTIEESRFYEMEVGLNISNGGFVNVICSAFFEGVVGVSASCKGVVCMQTCRFEFIEDHCITGYDLSRVHVAETAMRKCRGDGIAVGGGAILSLISCEFDECRLGVKIGSGLVSCHFRKSKFRSCLVGTYICLDASGRCVVDAVEYLCCEVAYLNLSGDLLHASCDGVVEPAGTQQQRLLDSASMMEYHGIQYGYPDISAFGAQMLQEAGVHLERYAQEDIINCLLTRRENCGSKPLSKTLPHRLQ